MLSKNIAKGLLAATLIAPVLFSAKPAQAAGASTTGGASATIVTPIAITAGAGLDFGQLAAGTGGTVTVTSAGARSATGDVALLGGAPAAGGFTVTGLTDAAYTITLPSAAITISFGTNTMSVGGWSGSKANGTLAGGSDGFTVGATLLVASGQAPGTYTGSYGVSVAYN